MASEYVSTISIFLSCCKERLFSRGGGGGGRGGLLQVEAFPVGTVGGSLVSAALLQANSLPRRPS